MQVNIYHYLNTLQKKPGAIRNSLALKSIPELKAIFDKHYSTRPRKFIDMLRKHSDLSPERLLNVLRDNHSMTRIMALDVVKSEQAPEQVTQNQLSKWIEARIATMTFIIE